MKQEILRRVAAKAQFRKQHEIGVQAAARLCGRTDDALGVAGDITDKKIQLSKSNSQRHDCGGGAVRLIQAWQRITSEKP
jgi:hypothetical protein